MFSVIQLFTSASSSPQVRFIPFWPGLSPPARRVPSDQVIGHFIFSKLAELGLAVSPQDTGQVHRTLTRSVHSSWVQTSHDGVRRRNRFYSNVPQQETVINCFCYLDNWRWMGGWRGAELVVVQVVGEVGSSSLSGAGNYCNCSCYHDCELKML